MRRGRIITGVISVMAAAVLIFVPAAMAATPQQISKDLADGKLDKTYSAADLQAFIKNAMVQQYPHTTPPTGGNLPGSTPGTNGAAGFEGNSGVLAETKSSGSLPFTGAELGIFALVGGLLLASGLVLRSTAKQKSRS